MKKHTAILSITALIAVFIMLFIMPRRLYLTRDARVLQSLFYQPQWEQYDFSKRVLPMMNIAPYFSDASPPSIIAASKDAGITSPILPTYPEALPETAVYYFAVFRETLDTRHGYELRFYAFADREDLTKIYSIWITAIPFAPLDGSVHLLEKQEFIYSVNDSPQSILEDMQAYFYSRSRSA